MKTLRLLVQRHGLGTTFVREFLGRDIKFTAYFIDTDGNYHGKGCDNHHKMWRGNNQAWSLYKEPEEELYASNLTPCNQAALAALEELNSRGALAEMSNLDILKALCYGSLPDTFLKGLNKVIDEIEDPECLI